MQKLLPTYMRLRLAAMPLVLLMWQTTFGQSTLARLEYYIDTDPGFGNATAITLTPNADSLANVTISVNPSVLLPGLHSVFLRAQNTNGTWGHDVKWLFVTPYASNKDTVPLGQVEYYLDNDPGFGKGTTIAIQKGTDSIANGILPLDVSAIPDGQHFMYLRARNSNGTWGHDVRWQFVNSAPLPLTLLSFNGTLQHSTAVLNWQTTDEINTQSFTIERSGDGLNYTALGNVPAADAPGINNYSFTDTKPLDGDNYYRLKMYDKDGAFTYSRIIKLNNGGGVFTIQVYPNPAATSATLAFNSLSAGKYSITVAGMDGKTIKRLEGVAATGANGLQLDISGLAAGVYMVTFNSADGTHVLKLVKQ